MSIMMVPSRHLSGMDSGAAHPWGMGASPKPKSKWTFGSLGQDSGTYVDLFGSDGSLPSNPIYSGGGGDFSGSGVQVDNSGNFFNPSNPNNAWFGEGPITSVGSSSAQPSWLTALESAFTTAGKVATVAEAPPGSYISPNGSVSIAPSAAQLAAQVSSYMPLILIGGGLVLVLALAGKH